MNQAEINATLDLAYADLKQVVSVVKKDLKVIINEAQDYLHKSIELSPGVTPDKHKVYTMTEGSPIQQAIALNSVKKIGQTMHDCLEHTEAGEAKDNLFNAVASLSDFIVSSHPKTEPEVKSEATEEVKKEEVAEEKESVVDQSISEETEPEVK